MENFNIFILINKKKSLFKKFDIIVLIIGDWGMGI